MVVEWVAKTNMMPIVTKAQAKAASAKKYFTGKPCIRGHISERWLVSGACCECVYQANTAWAKANAVQEKARKRQWFEKNRGACLEQSKEWQRNNRQQVTKRVARWRSKNRERVNARAVELRKANPDAAKLARSRWEQRNRHKLSAKWSARRAQKLNATPPWFGELDQFVMAEAADLCRLREQVTGVEWHVDHMIPLQAKEACGLHVAANIQVIPAVVNIAKGNRMTLTNELEWLRCG